MIASAPASTAAFAYSIESSVRIAPVPTVRLTLLPLQTVIPTTGIQIDRQNRQRQITMTANLEKSLPLAAAIEEVKKIETRIGLPKGVLERGEVHGRIGVGWTSLLQWAPLATLC